MYPARQLNEIAARKALLQIRIGDQRARATVECHRLAQPLHLADAAWQQWRQISPFVKLLAAPLALWAGHGVYRKRRLLHTAVKFAPLVLSAVQGFRAAQQRPGPQRSRGDAV